MGLSHSSTELALEQVMGLWTLWVQQILAEGFGEEAQGLCHFKPFCSQWQEWNRDFAEFQKKVEDANKQLAAIFCQGFDDCNRLSAAVKVPVPQLSCLAHSSHRNWESHPSWDCSRVQEPVPASLSCSWCTCLPLCWSDP